MSGRLVILPKKTYCPWKPENIERVLRDERLERERLEREAERETLAAAETKNNNKRQRSGQGGETGDGMAGTSTEGGHINLFPEAKEAELRLARGGQGVQRNDSNGGNKNNNDGGVLPVPLGGDEAAKRKAGAVPFYMRSKTKNNNSSDANNGNGVEGGEKYENTTGSFRLGNRARSSNAADAITAQITRDQFERREDGRKERMDPMSRFVRSVGADASSFSNNLGMATKLPIKDAGRDPERVKDDRKHRLKEKHRNKKSRRSYDSDSSTDSDGSITSQSQHSSSSSSSSSFSRDSSTSHHHKRRHTRREDKHNRNNRSRRKNRSSSRSDEEERYHRKKSRRRHSKDSSRRHHSRHRSQSRGHRSTSPDRSNSKRYQTHIGNKCTTDKPNNNELEELRNRRRAREARETERERLLLRVQQQGGGNGRDAGIYRSSGYQDQFNPTLSRN